MHLYIPTATEPTAAVSSMDAVTIEQLEMEAQLKLIDFFERNMKVFGGKSLIFEHLEACAHCFSYNIV